MISAHIRSEKQGRTQLYIFIFIFFAKQSKLVAVIHAYTLVTRSDPDRNTKLGFGWCTVSRNRKGRPRGGRTRRCSSPAKGPEKTWAPGLGGSDGRPGVATAHERARERESALGPGAVVDEEKQVAAYRQRQLGSV
jgi:hypothetical protein